MQCSRSFTNNERCFHVFYGIPDAEQRYFLTFFLFLQRGWHFMECIIRINLGTLMSKKTKYAMLVHLAQCWRQSRHMTCMFSCFLCRNECDLSVVSCFEERYIYSSCSIG